MTQSSMFSVPSGTRGFYFVLQANETGGTGSHQAGEVHVRKQQIGDFFPDLSADGKVTTDMVRTFFHAQRGEFGEITFTRYGKRYSPEERLRKFPPGWREGFEEGNVLVVIPAGELGIVYFLRPEGETPESLEGVWDLAKGENFGRFPVARAKKR